MLLWRGTAPGYTALQHVALMRWHYEKVPAQSCRVAYPRHINTTTSLRYNNYFIDHHMPERALAKPCLQAYGQRKLCVALVNCPLQQATFYMYATFYVYAAPEPGLRSAEWHHC